MEACTLTHITNTNITTSPTGTVKGKSCEKIVDELLSRLQKTHARVYSSIMSVSTTSTVKPTKAKKEEKKKVEKKVKKTRKKKEENETRSCAGGTIE